MNVIAQLEFELTTMTQSSTLTTTSQETLPCIIDTDVNRICGYHTFIDSCVMYNYLSVHFRKYIYIYIERERERERKWTQIQAKRETHIQTLREKDAYTSSEKYRDNHTHIDRKRETSTDTQTQARRERERETDRQTDRMKKPVEIGVKAMLAETGKLMTSPGRYGRARRVKSLGGSGREV